MLWLIRWGGCIYAATPPNYSGQNFCAIIRLFLVSRLVDLLVGWLSMSSFKDQYFCKRPILGDTYISGGGNRSGFRKDVWESPRQRISFKIRVVFIISPSWKDNRHWDTQEILCFYGNRSFILLFIRTHEPINLRALLILSSHIRLGLSSIFPSGPPAIVLYAFLCLPFVLYTLSVSASSVI